MEKEFEHKYQKKQAANLQKDFFRHEHAEDMSYVYVVNLFEK